MKHYRWFCQSQVCNAQGDSGCRWVQGYVEPNTQTKKVAQCNGTLCANQPPGIPQ